MSGVAWHRSLFLRLFALGAVVAVVAVVAATWATVRSTAVAVHQEQQQSLHADARTYDSLIGYAATHRDWSGAAALVGRMADRSGHRVTVTDPAGRVLLDSSSSTVPRSPSQARATLDALDVDTALLSTAAPTVVPSPVPARETAKCAPTQGCLYFIPASGAVDPRVVGPLVGSDRAGWAELQQRVDACLARAGLPAVAGIEENFSTYVAYPQKHGRVASCVESSRRAILQPYVAPRALLFVGDGDPTASVFWDLSGGGRLRIALLALAVLLVTLLLSALLAGYVVRPLRALAIAAGRAGDGDLDVRVDGRRRDEIGQMAQAFNAMADRRAQLESARRRMVSDVSHELRNPLANVRGWLEAAQDGLAEPDERLLASLHEETTHLQRLVDDLHQLSVGDAGELRLSPADVELGVVAEQVVASYTASADAAGVTLGVSVSPGATVYADPVRLRQAVGNLVANALRHTPRGGSVVVGGSPGVVTVSDTGEGIAAAELPFVFDRFRRVDASRSRATGGSGLGLAIVRQIVEAHGGMAEIESTVGEGTTVTLRF